ncbi:MAG TPA: hypothetical protein VMI92_00320, partial [Steroidobacteraceae bacterium]|nr:hypothetical protein [Steroidobacteraceae bacterium]
MSKRLTDTRMWMLALAAAPGLATVAGTSWSQTQGPVEIAVPNSNGPRPARPQEPTFDNPNKDPRDFEGVWLQGLGSTLQGYTPIAADAPDPTPAAPGAPTRPAAPGAPAFDPA